LKKKIIKKTGEVAQGIDPEIKPQFRKKKKALLKNNDIGLKEGNFSRDQGEKQLLHPNPSRLARCMREVGTDQG
jgi:hypothetical protein